MGLVKDKKSDGLYVNAWRYVLRNIRLSVCELVTTFTQREIPLQLYSLFNESLITRARAYACDEF